MLFKDGLIECSSSMVDVPSAMKSDSKKPVTPVKLQSPFQYKEKNNRTLFKDYKLLNKVKICPLIDLNIHTAYILAQAIDYSSILLPTDASNDLS